MITPTYNMSTGICWYDNAIPDKLCDELIELFDSSPDNHRRGITMSGNSDIKVTTDISIFPPGDLPINGVVTELDTYLSGFISDVMRDYMLTFDWLACAGDIIDTGFLIQKYDAGKGTYGEHIDGDPWTEHLNTRIFGIIGYLNTVDDGGGTYFRYQDLYINAIKGRVAIFPSSWVHPHTGTIPLSNDKYIVSCFAHPVRVLELPKVNRNY